jgi:VanZ family protein
MHSKKTINKNRAVFFYTLTVVWMGMIFFLSSLEGPGGNGSLSFIQLMLRKGAHVVEYFVLTLLSFQVLFMVHCTPMKKALIGAAGFALLYAFSDEIHQLFVIGREGKISDIGIDIIGIAIASLFLLMLYKRTSRRTSIQ